jgi:hypothetical protein
MGRNRGREMRETATIVLLTVLYSGSVAASPCADQTQRGLDACAGAARDKADAALNGAYKQIVGRLADNPGTPARPSGSSKPRRPGSPSGTPNAPLQIQIRRAARSIPWKSRSARRSSRTFARSSCGAISNVARGIWSVPCPRNRGACRSRRVHRSLVRSPSSARPPRLGVRSDSRIELEGAAEGYAGEFIVPLLQTLRPSLSTIVSARLEQQPGRTVQLRIEESCAAAQSTDEAETARPHLRPPARRS